MSVIDTLIFDRTTNDLINDTDKAYIDYKDLNRIEEACNYLAGIFNVDISTKNWVISDFRTESEMERIRSNIDLLKKSYYEVPGMTQLPTKITYTSIYEANDIERVLFELDELYKTVQSGLNRLSFTLGSKSIGNRKC